MNGASPPAGPAAAAAELVHGLQPAPAAPRAHRRPLAAAGCGGTGRRGTTPPRTSRWSAPPGRPAAHVAAAVGYYRAIRAPWSVPAAYRPWQRTLDARPDRAAALPARCATTAASRSGTPSTPPPGCPRPPGSRSSPAPGTSSRSSGPRSSTIWSRTSCSVVEERATLAYGGAVIAPTARTAVLVEGESDREAVLALAARRGVDLADARRRRWSRWAGSPTWPGTPPSSARPGAGCGSPGCTTRGRSGSSGGGLERAGLAPGPGRDGLAGARLPLLRARPRGRADPGARRRPGARGGGGAARARLVPGAAAAARPARPAYRGPPAPVPRRRVGPQGALRPAPGRGARPGRGAGAAGRGARRRAWT